MTARIRFTREPASDAEWATSFLKANAVELNPASSPAEVRAFRCPNGRWVLGEVDFAFSLLENPSAETPR
jgi:hypothetical protein